MQEELIHKYNKLPRLESRSTFVGKDYPLYDVINRSIRDPVFRDMLRNSTTYEYEGIGLEWSKADRNVLTNGPRKNERIV